MTGDQRAMDFKPSPRANPSPSANPSPRASRRLWISCWWLLACLPWALSAQGASVPIPVTIAAQLDAVTATGMNVDVDLTTRCSVDVVVKSAQCGEVDRISVVGDPDSAVSYSLSFGGLLQHAFACGPQFTVEVEGLKSHRPTLPFRVEIACDPRQNCSPQLVTEVTALGAIPMPTPLAKAWDELDPHTDLITALHRSRPELTRDIDTYAYHLAAWLKETGQELTDTCLCQWTGVVDQTPAREAAVAYPGKPRVSAFASASLTMVPRCMRLGTGEHRVLKGQEGGIYAALPAIESCPVPQGLQAEIGWEGEIWAAAGGDLGWDAMASTRFEVEVDSLPADIQLVGAERLAADLEDFAVDGLGVAATLTSHTPRNVEISLDSTVWVDMSAGASTFLEAHAWGEVLLWGVGFGGGGGGDPTPGQVRTSASIGGELDDTIDDGECIEHE